jgi:hypothetical protein
MDELRKLRNGKILTFLTCGGPESRQNEIANIHRLPMVVPVCDGGAVNVFLPPTGIEFFCTLHGADGFIIGD